MTIATAIWLTFLTVIWLSTAGAVAYAIWRYVLQPWRVLRADIVALNTKLVNLESQVQQLAIRRPTVMSDEDVAFAERKLRAQAAARRGVE